MMESLAGYDNWLLPKDPSPKSDCDGCQERFWNEDLTKIDELYLCEECLAGYKVTCAACDRLTHDFEDIVHSGTKSHFCPECAAIEHADMARRMTVIEGIRSAEYPEPDE